MVSCTQHNSALFNLKKTNKTVPTPDWQSEVQKQKERWKVSWRTWSPILWAQCRAIAVTGCCKPECERSVHSLPLCGLCGLLGSGELRCVWWKTGRKSSEVGRKAGWHVGGGRQDWRILNFHGGCFPLKRRLFPYTNKGVGAKMNSPVVGLVTYAGNGDVSPFPLRRCTW